MSQNKKSSNKFQEELIQSLQNKILEGTETKILQYESNVVVKCSKVINLSSI